MLVNNFVSLYLEIIKTWLIKDEISSKIHIHTWPKEYLVYLSAMNAWSPVIARPRIRAWMSWVPVKINKVVYDIIIQEYDLYSQYLDSQHVKIGQKSRLRTPLRQCMITLVIIIGQSDLTLAKVFVLLKM